MEAWTSWLCLYVSLMVNHCPTHVVTLDFKRGETSQVRPPQVSAITHESEDAPRTRVETAVSEITQGSGTLWYVLSQLFKPLFHINLPNRLGGHWTPLSVPLSNMATLNAPPFTACLFNWCTGATQWAQLVGTNRVQSFTTNTANSTVQVHNSLLTHSLPDGCLDYFHSGHLFGHCGKRWCSWSLGS